MMVDYSDWLNSLPGEFHLNTGWFLVINFLAWRLRPLGRRGNARLCLSHSIVL